MLTCFRYACPSGLHTMQVCLQHRNPTISRASEPASSMVCRMRGMSLVTPVAVSLCTTATALMDGSAYMHQAEAKVAERASSTCRGQMTMQNLIVTNGVHAATRTFSACASFSSLAPSPHRESMTFTSRPSSSIMSTCRCSTCFVSQRSQTLRRRLLADPHLSPCAKHILR
jgi:hypothetical protein